ncbi:5'-nucleotidase C-terminal domain-containing protein [Flavobacterium dankookense]|uniref:5'-nucleotidase-like protein n=1 Tax=Flavobacterium dankookense TaxID=706186 RepID=A0A4R6Q589_9FLAO|nr:5'-nucleotidase [Flavobacterium dankookense]TDP57544.1 5'-nucleotidase-like protein [Flavobacterium dankookense]
MVKLKNYNVVLKQFVLILTFALLLSCGEKKYFVTKIEGKKISIENSVTESTEIENFVKPYRESIDKDLSQVLSFAPETLDKTGTWQTPIGNFLSDITLEKTQPIFEKRENKSIDICLLNHGGIRSIIPSGNVTSRTAYEIMPFENTTIVVGLKAEQIEEIVSYIISEKKPHPLSGMSFTIDKNNNPTSILVNNKPLEKNKIYYVVTSDYLVNGGDNMTFFQKGVEKYNLDYKLRNVLIDYFKTNKEIKANTNIRINKE